MKRQGYIDLFKGIGIFLMVLGHTIANNTLEIWIYGFHMPLFFIASGYLYKDVDDVCLYIKKKAKALLIPYFIFAIIYILIWKYTDQGAWNRILTSDWLTIIYPSIDLSIPLNGSIWFLVALFWCDLISLFIIKYTGKYKAIFFILCVVIGMAVKEELPFAVLEGLIGAFFYGFGYYIKKLDLVDYKIPTLLEVITGIISVILIFTNGMVTLISRSFGGGRSSTLSMDYSQTFFF